MNYYQIFLFIYFPWCQFDVFEYLYVCIVIYYSSIHINFHSGNVRYESVVELMYIDYSLFGCAVEKMYIISQKYFKRSHLFLTNIWSTDHIQRFSINY